MASKLAVAAAVASATLAAALPSPPTTQIVGGTEAREGEFPYIVSLQQGGSHFCGGSLLNANTVMTAAHCSVGTAPASVTVVAGTNTWSSGGESAGVQEILVHPDYTQLNTNNDIALWHLSTPLTQSGSIGFVSIASSEPSAGATTTVAGWGLLNENGVTLPQDLMKVDVPIVSRAECNSAYGGSITDAMICAGYPQGGQDACSGDSGGPQVNSAGTQVGIVSWGQGCAQAGYPGVYTNVAAFTSWIQANAW